MRRPTDGERDVMLELEADARSYAERDDEWAETICEQHPAILEALEMDSDEWDSTDTLYPW